MPTREVAEWSTTDASNNFTAEEGGWAEGMKRSDVNDAARADMGAIRRWYDDPEWLDLTVGASLTRIDADTLEVQAGDYTSYFTAGRLVKITESLGGPTYATVKSSDFATYDPNTRVELKDFYGPDSPTGVPTDLVQIYCYITSFINPSSIQNNPFIFVTDLTGAAIQSAIDTLEAGAGGVIVLEPNATYVVSTNPIDIGTGVSEGNIRIIGRGATLQADTDLNDHILIIDDSAVAIDAKTVLEDITFDGNSANQSAGTGDSLHIGQNVSYVWVQRCRFTDSYIDSVYIDTSASKVWITDCEFDDMGENGILTAAVSEVYIDKCAFSNPSNGSAAAAACISFNGPVHISNCDFINMNHATDTQTGIEVLTGSRSAMITSCRFKGTGLNTQAMIVQGDDCVISNCTFNLTGANTEGIYVGLGGGAAERNVITGCNFIDVDRAVQMLSTSNDNIIQGCNFESCPFPYTDDGSRNRFISNVMSDGTDGVTISANAVEAIISNNTIDTMSSDGINVAGGATRTQLLHNVTTNCTTTHVTDASTTTGEIGGFRGYVEEFALATSISTQVFSAGVEALVSDGASNDFLQAISELADGKRVWVVDQSIINGRWATGEAGGQAFTLRLRHGTNSGTPGSDTIIAEVDLPMVGASSVDDPFSVTFKNAEFTPASGDDVYLTMDAVTGASFDWQGSDVGLDSFFKIRPK